jgi:hypothetical protein
MSAVQPRLFGIEQTQTTSDDYYTPKWIFDALGLHFDLDVASPPHPTSVPCDRYYTQADDGLASPWYGRVWMNPPFSNIPPWVERWLDHRNGIALLPLSGACDWTRRIWSSDASMLMIQETPKFERNGKKVHIMWPVALWAIGDDNIGALQNIGRVR